MLRVITCESQKPVSPKGLGGSLRQLRVRKYHRCKETGALDQSPEATANVLEKRGWSIASHSPKCVFSMFTVEFSGGHATFWDLLNSLLRGDCTFILQG